MATTHYRHSGKTPPSGLLAIALVTGLAAPILALIYSALTICIPLVYVNFFLTVGFGAGLGAAVGWAAKAGHIRNTPLTLIAVVGAALVAYYLHWVFWFGVHAMRADGSFGDALPLLFPPALFETIGFVNEEGTWGFKSVDSVSGWPLTIVWILEALIFFGAAIVGSFATAASVYCESCGTWCAEHVGVRRFSADASSSALAARLDQGDLNALTEAAPADPGAQAWTQLDMDVCTGCAQTNTLTMKSIRIETDSKGKTSQKDEVLVDRLLLTPEQARWLIDGSGTSG